MEFDYQPDGSVGMIVALRNRNDDMSTYEGFVNGARLLRVCNIGPSDLVPQWELEYEGTCGDYVSDSQSTGSQWHLRGSQNKFFSDQGVEGSFVGGAIKQLPGFAEVMVPATDNVSNNGISGMAWLSNMDGTRSRDIWALNAGTADFYKANNWGSLSAACEAPPLEVGNYVWCDANSDGVQDPSEAPVPGVDVQLICDIGGDGFGVGFDRTASMSTDADGYYVFNDSNVPGGMPLNTTCRVVIDNTSTNNATTLTNVCGSPGPTTTSPTNPLGDGLDESRDSDGATIAGVTGVGVEFTTGGSGENDHRYDFGFGEPTPAYFGDRVWIESDNDGLASTGVITPVVGMVITATDGITTYTATTNADGYYSFTVPGGVTYTVTYGEVPAEYGTVAPSATPSGSSESGNAGTYAETGNPDISHENGTTVYLNGSESNWLIDFAFWVPQPAITLEKATNGEDADTVTGPTVTAGDTVTWTYALTNTGNITLTNITLSDDQEDTGGATCAPVALGGDLIPGESTICTLTGIAAAGQYTNTAVVTGTPIITTILPVTSTDPSHYVTLAQFGDRVWLESDGDGLASTGVITPLAGMVITATSGPPGTNVYTATTTATGYYSFSVPGGVTYTVSYGPIPAPYGDAVASATPGGSSESGSAGSYAEGGDPDQSHENGTTVYVEADERNWHVDFAFWLPDPEITLEKATNGEDADTVTGPTLVSGDPVTWTYAFTNTGNITLTNIILSDEQDDTAAATCVPVALGGILSPGGSTVCTLTGVAAVGQYTNTAIVTGTPTVGPTAVVTSTDPSHYIASEQIFDLALIKELADGQSAVVMPGDLVTFTITIFNQGEADAFDIDIVEYIPADMELADHDWSDGGSTNGVTATLTLDQLNAGQQTTVDVTLQVDAGFAGTSITNYAEIADGTNTDGGSTTPDIDSTPDGVNGNSAGETTNLSDNIVSGNSANGEDEDDHDPASITVAAPSITLEKATNGEDADTVTGPSILAGDPVTWTYAFTNTGNVTLTNITLGDDREDASAATCAPVALGGELIPGAGTVCTLTGVAVAGQYTNTAVVTGTPTITGLLPVTSTDPSHYLTPAQFGDRVWIESDGDGLASTGVITPVAGMLITATDGVNVYFATTNAQGYYSFTVPGDAVYTVTYGLVPAAYGSVIPTDTPGGSSESGSAGSYAEAGNPDQSHANDTIVTVAAGESNWHVDFAFWTPQPTITLEKTTNGEDADTPTGPGVRVGDTVTWTYEITNTGNVTLTDITLVDDPEGTVTTCPLTVLGPGAGMSCVTTGVAVAGQYTNTAVVTGTPTVTGTGAVTSTDPSHHVGEVFDLALRKVLADGQSSTIMPGDDITFTIVVSNQGTVDAFDLTISEYLPTGLSLSVNDSNGWSGSGSTLTNTVASLTAGSETTLDVVLTLADPFTGTSVTNLAEISAADDDTDPSTDPPTDVDSDPDSDPDNEDNVKDDVTDEDGKNTGDGDEDDHDPETVTVVQPAQAQFGDRVFIESDGDGLASTGVITPIVGMVITATDGTDIYTTTTNAQGYYSFTVPAETYTITYGSIPAGYAAVVPSDTPGGSSESGVAGAYIESGNPDRSHENGTTVTVAAGESNWLIDFAFWLPDPTITLEKSTNGEDADTPSGPLLSAGDTVSWTYEITNTGNVTLTDLTVTDSQEGSVTCPQSALAPGAGMRCTVTGVAVAGQYSNTAIVTGTPTITGTPAVTSTDPSHYATPAQFGDRVFIEDDGDGMANTGFYSVVEGMVITATDGTTVYTTTTNSQGYYRFTVPGGVTYTVTYGEVPAEYGTVVPSSTPGGSSESGSAGTYQEAGNPDQSHENGTTVYVDPGEENWHVDFGFWLVQPVIELEKATNGEDADTVTGPIVGVGDTVTWTYEITNTGTVTLTNLTLVDDQEGTVTCPLTELAPGAAMSCVLTGVAVAGQYTNTAVVTGTPAVGPTDPVTSTDPSHYLTPTQFGDRVWVEDDGDGLANTGSLTPVEGLVITATAGIEVYTTTTNAQGYYSFTVPGGVTYTVTYGEVPFAYGIVVPSNTPGGSSESGSAGSYAEGGDPDQSHENGTTVFIDVGESNWHVDFAFTPRPDLVVSKTASLIDVSAGDLMTYTITVNNPSTVSALDIVVRDRLPAGVVYSSHVASVGTYSVVNGEWIIPVLPPGSATLTITVVVD